MKELMIPTATPTPIMRHSCFDSPLLYNSTAFRLVWLVDKYSKSFYYYYYLLRPTYGYLTVIVTVYLVGGCLFFTI